MKSNPPIAAGDFFHKKGVTEKKLRVKDAEFFLVTRTRFELVLPA